MTDSTGDYDSSGYGWPLVMGFNPIMWPRRGMSATWLA